MKTNKPKRELSRAEVYAVMLLVKAGILKLELTKGRQDR